MKVRPPDINVLTYVIVQVAGCQYIVNLLGSVVNIKYSNSLPYNVIKIDLGVANFGRGTYRGQGGAYSCK